MSRGFRKRWQAPSELSSEDEPSQWNEPESLPSSQAAEASETEHASPIFIADIRLVAGHLLLGIFGVARWGDLRHMQHFSLDEYKSVVIFEAGSTDHKLARSAEAQVELFPYIGLGVWPGEDPWLPVLFELREQEGFHSGLPAYDWGRETWSQHAMSTAEATSWLREMLAGHMPHHERCRAHSLKTTLLTWAGMSPRFSRRPPHRNFHEVRRYL